MFSVRHICPISGKDSLATAIVMRAREPSLPMEYVFHEVGWDLPEVIEWINRAEQFLKQPIVRCGKDIDTIIEEQGILPSRTMRLCTKYAKIFPMNEFAKGEPFTIYLGLRADETDRIAGLRDSKHETQRFPLQELGLRFANVYGIVERAGMLPPDFFWPWMFDRVMTLGGARPKNMPEWEWRSLFAGRSRPNCGQCFFKRQYEWIWLHEVHPVIFEKACNTEDSTQEASSYRWLGEGVPLQSILERAAAIKERRAREITKLLSKRCQGELFPVIEDNPFGATSCGLFCGK